MNKGYYINEAKCSKEVFDNYMDLLHENKQLKEVIDEVREHIESNMRYVENDDGAYELILDRYDIRDILEILYKAKEDINECKRLDRK